MGRGANIDLLVIFSLCLFHKEFLHFLWFINGEGCQYWLAGNVFFMLVSQRVFTFLGAPFEKFQNFVWLLTKSFYISRLSRRGISEFLPVPYGQAGSFRTKSTPIHSVTIASSIQSCCIPSTGALPVLVRNVWYHILVIKQWVFLQHATPTVVISLTYGMESYSFNLKLAKSNWYWVKN